MVVDIYTYAPFRVRYGVTEHFVHFLHHPRPCCGLLCHCLGGPLDRFPDVIWMSQSIVTCCGSHPACCCLVALPFQRHLRSPRSRSKRDRVVTSPELMRRCCWLQERLGGWHHLTLALVLDSLTGPQSAPWPVWGATELEAASLVPTVALLGVRRLLMPGYLAQGDVDGQTAGTALPCLAVRPQGFSTPELGIFSQGSPTRHAPCV